MQATPSNKPNNILASLAGKPFLYVKDLSLPLNVHSDEV